MMQIHDPIHGYICLDGMYAHIVNTPEFQRLRSIEQVSFRPVYPGARHDRFLHSLGTYHLAGKFADCFFRNLKKDLKITLPAAEEKLLRTTFSYAALLHDIGHAPFSHTTEDFFAEEKSTRPSADPIDNPYPLIWDDLCLAVQQVNPLEGDLFFGSGKKQGASHEIMSSILLIENRFRFIPEQERENVDPALAARIVIGFPYCIGDLNLSPESRGVRNCLIRLLNGEVMDVDRLDYMGRDTLMTGYTNAPLDLDCLADSVTALRLENNELTLAYRDSALAVFDLMFQAKLSHDAWVIGNPAGQYDSALRIHCIRKLDKLFDEKGKGYIREIFCKEALSYEGKPWNGKIYRLLDDSDISSDLKAQSGLGDPDFDELFTRELGKRRIAAWRSYYEYHRIFNSPDPKVTPESVYKFFTPLMKHMSKAKLFIFNQEAYDAICTHPKTKSNDPAVLKAAFFLRKYLRSLSTDPEKKDAYNVVLLDRTLNLTMKLDPMGILIAFPRKNIPKRFGNMNYASYGELTGISADDIVKRQYFYLFRHGGLGIRQLEKLCSQLASVL